MALTRPLLTLLLLFLAAGALLVSARPVACEEAECRPGRCEFSDCTEPVACKGGLCTFTNCASPSCQGGHCKFYSCSNPTCAGGRCTFIDTTTTLGSGYCNGGACIVDGYEFSKTFEDNLAF